MNYWLKTKPEKWNPIPKYQKKKKKEKKRKEKRKKKAE